jgi:hypothetical protein
LFTVSVAPCSPVVLARTLSPENSTLGAERPKLDEWRERGW